MTVRRPSAWPERNGWNPEAPEPRRSGPGALLLGQAGDDLVPDAVGQQLLGGPRHRDLGTVRAEDDGLVLRRLEPAPRTDLVHHEQVAALAGQLGPTVLQRARGVVAGLGGEADHDLAGTRP